MADARTRLRVRGAVQGVGFRPFVYRVAQELGLTGFTFNDAEGVVVEAQGPAATLAELQRRLHDDAPPLSRVEAVEATPLALAEGASGFAILASRGGADVKTAIPPDVATCGDCLRELFDPANRRHRHPFINCTQCGPRFTLTRSLPYDRPMTSMAAFPMCAQCQAEYEDPTDRRFHAEPNACPQCGPRLSLVDTQGAALEGDPIAATLALLRAGRIVAVKALGGFHLACDATNAAAVAALRQRKQREEKPFAVMAADLDQARRWVQLSAQEALLLACPERPVLLLPLQPGAGAQLPGVAPGLDVLGLMLPGTPIQQLLFHDAPGLLLVMTSANPGGEPIVIGNGEALQRLAGIADAVLLHDRDILARCDDSVMRVDAAGTPRFVRRARGWTPRPIKLARAGPPVLATGAWLKNTVCLTRGDEAFLSPHIGDLDNAATCTALEEAVAHLQRVLDVKPVVVAHDLHPDFFSTRFAAAFAAAQGLRALPVQHHHAHIAAVAAEHRFTGPLLGLALDGVGLGNDGDAWGGELLGVNGASCTRLGHLRPIALPGGDVAAREPWRVAAAALHALGRGEEIALRFGHHAAAPMVAQMLERGLRCPPTSSLGRWFDAAAALLHVRELAAFEGQAPMLLEALASGPVPSLDPAELVPVTAAGGLDPLPLFARLRSLSAAEGASLFHHALADGLSRWVLQAAAREDIGTVAFGGGCFLNARLSGLVQDQLERAGLRVLQARQAPPNDGGIALGQAWVALCSSEQ